MTDSPAEIDDIAIAPPPRRPAGRRGRPRKSDTAGSGATRDSLLQAARDVMIAKNSIDVSLAEISEITGNSPGLIVYHFQNKEGLLLSLIELDAQKAVSQLEGLKSMDISSEKKMRMHIGGIVSAYYKTPYANRLLNELMQNASAESAQKVSAIFLKPIADFQRELLEQGLREGVFRKVDPTDFYFIVLGACDHLFARQSALAYIFDTHEIDETLRRRYSRSLTDLVMAGIVAV